MAQVGLSLQLVTFRTFRELTNHPIQFTLSLSLSLSLSTCQLIRLPIDCTRFQS